MNIRLAISTTGELFGGVERHVLGMCQFSCEQQTTPPLLVLYHEGELAKQARAAGFLTEVIEGPRYSLDLARRTARILSAHQIDLVHVHGYKASIACALARRRHSFRLVKTEHSRVGPLAGQPVVWAKAHLNRYLDAMITRRDLAAVCYVTDDLQHAFDWAHRGLPRQVIYNGIAPLQQSDYPRPPEFEQTCFQVSIVGRISAVKGISYALHALKAEGIPEEVRLNILGTGPLSDKLQRQIEDLGLQKQVRILGFRSEIYDYIAHSNILLMPSLGEGLPYTILEAMALNTPIVASDVGGLSEVLQHEKTALLVPPCDPAAIRSAVNSLASTPERGRQLAEAARDDFEQRFTLSRMGRTYWKLYQEVLNP